MKKRIVVLSIVFILFAFSAQYLYSFCWGCRTEEPKTRYTPVYLTRDELNASIKSTTAQSMRKTGKIYLKGDLIFINEKYKGIHVINNLDPSNPVNSQFISIPGCIDMAAKGNIIYADNAVDLVAIDISDVTNVKVTKREEYVFPDLLPPDGLAFSRDASKGIIVEWK